MTDATQDAEQWHIAPCQFCGPNFLGTCPHRPRNRELTTSYVAPGPAPCVNMDALIRYFEKELQRERDRVAVERTAAASAREALAACEERLRAAHVYAGKLDEARLAAVGEANRYAVERDNALAELERVRNVNAELTHKAGELCEQRDEALGRLKGEACQLRPGSTAAVIEAYRLLSGYEPVFGVNGQWADGALPSDSNFDAERALLLWLNKNAPGGRP